MSPNNQAIEAQVDQLATIAPRSTGAGGHLRYDKAFARLMDMLASRIAYQVRRYGLGDMADDAQQVCAIAVHRALESYDPGKASFTTHATWLIKGELQSLRHRVRLDQRQSAQSANIRTVSLDGLVPTSGNGALFEIVDETAERAMQSSVGNAMARRSLKRLLDQIRAPGFERQIVWDTLYDRAPSGPAKGASGQPLSSEQRRQIVRRTFRNCARAIAA